MKLENIEFFRGAIKSLKPKIALVFSSILWEKVANIGIKPNASDEIMIKTELKNFM